MRRPVRLALAALVVLLLGSTAVLFQKYRKTAADFTDMKAAEQSARSQYAEAFSSIAEIQDSLNAISTGDTTVRLTPEGLEKEQELTGPNRREALDRIALLNASIQRTKQRIGELESSLRHGGIRIAGLERMVVQLKRSVAEKEAAASLLASRVDSLQTQVAGLESTVELDRDALAAKDQTIEDKQRELGTIYFIVGTKKELSSSGVIVAKGGVLGLGKTLLLSGRFDEHLFTALDTDEETVVRAPAPRVQVLSPQPLSSYELRTAGNRVELHILDPKEFRKVKHLVIMTT